MKSPDMLPNFKARKLKIVCCLYGGPHIGKSETMTAFGQTLFQRSRYYYEQKGQHSSHDRRIVLKYKGMIVGICTAGDDPNTIDGNFDFFDQQHCDIGFTSTRVETNNDMCAYARSKSKKARFVNVPKRDMSSEFARQMVKAGVVDHFASSLKRSGYKEIYKQLVTIH